MSKDRPADMDNFSNSALNAPSRKMKTPEPKSEMKAFGKVMSGPVDSGFKGKDAKVPQPK